MRDVNAQACADAPGRGGAGRGGDGCGAALENLCWNSQFAPIRKPLEFARSHPNSQRVVQVCEFVGAFQRVAAIPIRNHL